MQIHLLPSTAIAYEKAASPGEFSEGDIVIVQAEKVVAIVGPLTVAITVNYGSMLHIGTNPLSSDYLSALSPTLVRAFGQAALRGWAVRENVTAVMGKVQQLTCSCCGSYHKGRQWWNRDDGYGLCDNCIDDCITDPMDFLEAGATYGVPGYHYDIDGSHFRAKAGA